MILLVSYKSSGRTEGIYNYPEPIVNFDNYISMEYVGDEINLCEINTFLIEKKLPIMNNTSLLITNGSCIVYYNNTKNIQYYIINSKHNGYFNLYREYKINKILL